MQKKRLYVIVRSTWKWPRVSVQCGTIRGFLFSEDIVKRIIASALALILFQQSAFAQFMGSAPVPLKNPASDAFRPVHLRSMLLGDRPEKIRFLVDPGYAGSLTRQRLKKLPAELMSYFRTGILVPESTLWVNLRPDAEDRMLDTRLEGTDLGKVLLQSDLQLKKDIARFSSPKTTSGRHYWDRLYAKCSQLFGAEEDITIPSCTRPWIVPDEIVLRSSRQGVYVYKATLKVKLEEDHIAGPGQVFPDERMKELNAYSSALMRELVLPRLTKEVNSSRRYAQLRQAYYSLILAQWFKKNYSGTARMKELLRVQPVKQSWNKKTYFNAYCRSFSKGEYRMHEQVRDGSGVNIRTYFSGGITFQGAGPVHRVAFDGGLPLQPEIPGLLTATLEGGDVLRIDGGEERKRPKERLEDGIDGLTELARDYLKIMLGHMRPLAEFSAGAFLLGAAGLSLTNAAAFAPWINANFFNFIQVSLAAGTPLFIAAKALWDKLTVQKGTQTESVEAARPEPGRDPPPRGWIHFRDLVLTGVGVTLIGGAEFLVLMAAETVLFKSHYLFQLASEHFFLFIAASFPAGLGSTSVFLSVRNALHPKAKTSNRELEERIGRLAEKAQAIRDSGDDLPQRASVSLESGEARNDGGSAVGGIDMRGLNVEENIVPMTLPQCAVPVKELEQIWQGIEMMLAEGRSACEEIEELAKMCCGRPDAAEQRKKLHACIAQILKSEEEAAMPTPAALRKALGYLG